MKTHPGASTPVKAQTNDTDIAEDCSSNSANKSPEEQEENQGLAKSPEKEDSTDTKAIGVVPVEPMDTTV